MCGGIQSTTPLISSLQPSQLKSGTLIYDTQGKVIGHLGVDGKVRDGNGQIIGQVGPDGLVRSERWHRDRECCSPCYGRSSL